MKSIRLAFVAVAITAIAWVSPHAQQLRQWGLQLPTASGPQEVLSRKELFSEDHTADVLAIEQVEAAYGYYDDTHNGPGMASLFTDDAVGVFGGNSVGKGCRLTPLEQVAWFYGFNRTAELDPKYRNGLSFPVASHHVMTNMLVKVSDDGKTAMLTATFIYTQSSNGSIDGVRNSRMANDGKGPRLVDSGAYRNYFRKTPEGWKIYKIYLGGDPHPRSDMNTSDETVGPACDSNGRPIPLPSN
jgi:hypothetical protein